MNCMADLIDTDYVPSDNEPFMNERQKAYFREKLINWKNDILREARERQEDENYTAPAQKITDPEELAVYRLKERKHFEDRLRMSRHAIGTWLKYAAFEEAQRDFERARSVYERALVLGEGAKGRAGTAARVQLGRRLPARRRPLAAGCLAQVVGRLAAEEALTERVLPALLHQLLARHAQRLALAPARAVLSLPLNLGRKAVEMEEGGGGIGGGGDADGGGGGMRRRWWRRR